MNTRDTDICIMAMALAICGLIITFERVYMLTSTVVYRTPPSMRTIAKDMKQNMNVRRALAIIEG